MKKYWQRILALLVSLTLLMTNCIPLLAVEVADIANSWAKQDILEWIDKGWARYYEDGTFRPNQSITRAEFIEILNNAFEIATTDTDPQFSDVSESEWFFDEVAKAKAAGYIEGYPDNTFKPNGYITRQEASKVIAEMLNMDIYPKDVISDFTDSKKISGWAKDSVNGLIGYGAINGYPNGSFKPTNTITRAEALTILKRAHTYVSRFTGIYAFMAQGEPANPIKVELFKENGTFVTALMTNSEGIVEFKDLQPGKYYLQAKHGGSQNAKKEFIHVKDGFMSLYEIRLADSDTTTNVAQGSGTQEPTNPKVDVDLEKVQSDYYKLRIGYQTEDTAECVTQDIVLPMVGENGSTITWKSSDQALISHNGTVIRPTDESEIVTLTATLSKGKHSKDKAFTLKVIRKNHMSSDEIAEKTLEDMIELNDGVEPEILIGEEGIPVDIEGCYSDVIVESPEEAILSLYSIKSAMNMTDPKSELAYFTTNRDESGVSYTFTQMYEGIPVSGRTMVVTTDAAGKVIALGSSYKPNIDIDTVPLIGRDEACEIAKQIGGGESNPEDALLMIYSLRGASPQLAWEIIVQGEVPQNVIIDATNGENLINTPLIFSEVPAKGIDLFEEKRSFYTKWIDELINTYALEDEGRGIAIYNASNIQQDWGQFGDLYKNPLNFWSDAAAVSAMANTVVAYDYFKDLGWESFDGRGLPIKVSVHMKNKEGNDLANAYFSPSLIQMAFGAPGDRYKYNTAAALDTVGHEYTHGVMHFKTNLSWHYYGYTGAINEGYADVFGYFIEGDNDEEWLHGEDNTKYGRAGRNMSDPNEFGQPDAVGGEYYKDPTEFPTELNDMAGVHYNNTIISHAAYTMYEKGMKDKERLARLWYKSLSFGYDGLSTFHNVRLNVLKAAHHLGYTDTEKAIIRAAFDHVNILDERLSTISGTVYGSDMMILDNVKITFVPTNALLKECVIFTDSAGSFNSGSIPNGIYSVIFEKDDVRIYSKEYNLFGEDIQEDIYLNFGGNCSVSGKITIADEDNNASNNLPLDAAQISVYSKLDSEAIYATTTTEADGMYTLTGLGAGEYRLTVMKEGYLPVEETIVIKEDEENYFNITIEAIPDLFEGLGTGSGMIFDVLTGQGVADLTLNIRAGLNNTDGPIIASIQTDGDGKYSTEELEAGHYAIEIVDERILEEESYRYLSNVFNIKILGDTHIPAQNGSVSIAIDINQLRIVLQWGSTPNDLDSHFIGPTSDGNEFHIYYGDKTYMENDMVIAELDLDDTSSYGPETTTLYNPIDGEYTFVVHDYSNNWETDNTELSNSGAYVQVYIGSSNIPLYVFYVPQGIGTYWEVFKYDSVTQKIIPINQISNDLRSYSMSGIEFMNLPPKDIEVPDVEVPDTEVPDTEVPDTEGDLILEVA